MWHCGVCVCVLCVGLIRAGLDDCVSSWWLCGVCVCVCVCCVRDIMEQVWGSECAAGGFVVFVCVCKCGACGTLQFRFLEVSVQQVVLCAVCVCVCVCVCLCVLRVGQFRASLGH